MGLWRELRSLLASGEADICGGKLTVHCGRQQQNKKGGATLLALSRSGSRTADPFSGKVISGEMIPSAALQLPPTSRASTPAQVRWRDKV